MRRAAIAAFIPLLIIALPEAQAGEIHLKDGTVLKVGEIRSATTEKVSFKQGGGVQSRRAENVARIIPTGSGDSSLELALKRMAENAPPDKIRRSLDTTLKRGKPDSKPYALFFIAELLEREGNSSQALKTYDEVAEKHKSHFYAPVALTRAARMSRGNDAVARYDKLASGAYGRAWKDAGEYGKARLLLAGNKVDDALSSFNKLTGSSDKSLASLAECGKAHCQLLKGKARDAERTFKSKSKDKGAGAEVMGYGWKGLGDCQKKSKPDEALVSYLRSVLLYPSNPERGNAAQEAGKLLLAKKLGGEKRISGPVRWQDYSGDQPNAELLRRLLQFVSAHAVRELAPDLLKSAKGDEKADIEFLEADAIKVVGRNDPALLEEYEKKLKALRKKYPNHGRVALAGVDGFVAAKDRALALISKANEETGAKRTELLEEGRSVFAEVLGPFKKSIERMTRQVDALLEKGEAGDLPDADQKQLDDLEHKRDLSEFLLAEAYASFARTFDEGDEERKKNFNLAKAGYDHYIMERGSNVQWLWYSYIGKGEMSMEVGEYDEAVYTFEEMTAVEWPFPMPKNPDHVKGIKTLLQDMCIRAYHGLTRALMQAGKGKEAYERSQEIDKNKSAGQWRDHPMGILLTLERAKALGTSGRGAEGAKELYLIIRKAKKAPESEKIAALGMSREGAGACRALSELSDLTGGEIYAPQIQYYTGVGYFLRQRPVLAIAGYKGVLTAARTRKQRQYWVPKAVREIGNLLFQQQRYLEAALAYQTVFTEFPDHELAEEAVRFAISASKKAITQFGEDPTNRSSTMVAFARKIESSIGEAAGPEYEAKLIITDAKELHTKQKWLGAAKRYLDVKSDFTDETGKKKRISFYPNAVANSGYCYFQAYKQKKQKSHLNLARENLKKASKVAGEAGDRASQALASFYLGQLENQLKRPKEALLALKPFDGPLASQKGFAVRARFEQAMACLALNQSNSVSKAEAYFKKISGETKDDSYGPFAYNMASKLRSKARALAKKGGSPEGSRKLFQKAGRYAKAFIDSRGLQGTRRVVLFWVGSALFDGGYYKDAAKVYKHTLKAHKRPALKDGTDKKAEAASAGFDVAALYYGYSLVGAKKYDEALAQLNETRNSVYVQDRDGRRLAYGTFAGRELKGPFKFKYQGRTQSRKIWFTTVKFGEETKTYFDTEDPRGGETEFVGVEGNTYKAGYQPSDVRTLVLPLKADFMIVKGLAEATWAKWEADGDKKFLATEVTEANNLLRYVLRGMDADSYSSLVSTNQLTPLDYVETRWDADLKFLEIKMAREKWREVVSDIEQMKLLGTYKKAPSDVKERLDALLDKSKSKS